MKKTVLLLGGLGLVLLYFATRRALPTPISLPAGSVPTTATPSFWSQLGAVFGTNPTPASAVVSTTTATPAGTAATGTAAEIAAGGNALSSVLHSLGGLFGTSDSNPDPISASM